MINGINKFKEVFKDYQNQYVVIGGGACEILMNNAGLIFRSTKDIDMVLIIESLSSHFAKQFWDYIKEGGYEFQVNTNSKPHFYRFIHPKNNEYPIMIEIFSRSLKGITLPENAVLTPIPFEDEISSLSAILLDEDYYSSMKSGRCIIDDIVVLKAEYIIPFKAKAYLDLLSRKNSGNHVDSKDIKKHRNDIFRLFEIIEESNIQIPISIYNDIIAFIDQMKQENIDLKALGIKDITKNQILDAITKLYSPLE